MPTNSKAIHERIEKPWGYELIWAHTEKYVGKILFIKAGESLSLQYHREKEETLFLESGICIFQYGENQNELKTVELQAGEGFHILPGLIHRMEAKTDCRMFEVSTPQLKDVVRLKDNYGRSS